ncbi:hypothetical protein [Enhygromyxa salina]|nr:hypothetical protein [Enhygromyxa salina]
MRSIPLLALLTGCDKQPDKADDAAPTGSDKAEVAEADKPVAPEPEPKPKPEPVKPPLELAAEACKADAACKDEGRCSAKPGAEDGKFECVAASIEDCRASAKCKAEATCSFDEAAGACANLELTDCFYTDGCLHEGLCYGSKRGGCESGRKGQVAQHYGTLEYEGALEVDLFRRILRVHTDDLRTCRATGRASGKGVNGMAHFGWTITAEGTVADLAILADGLETPAFATCMIEKLATYSFVKPKDGKPIKMSMGFSFPS